MPSPIPSFQYREMILHLNHVFRKGLKRAKTDEKGRKETKRDRKNGFLFTFTLFRR